MTIKLKKILFIDRDGVINKNAPKHEYIIRAKDFVFNPGIFKLLKKYQKQRFEIIVITNQRGIARKKLSLITLNNLHQKMSSRLIKKGIKILDILVCPHENNTCQCRKPRPGLLKQAVKKYKINLNQSVLLSDSKSDVIMGREFGIKKSYLVKRDRPGIIVKNNA